MNTKTGSFQTRDNQKIHTIQWLPETLPKAIVILVHGIAEHSGRYAHVAEALVNAGYAVYSLDHRGHGRSDGMRGYFDSFEKPVTDLKTYVDQIKSTHPDAKIFMVGHSMGSLISLMFVLRHQSDLAGWVSSGSPVKLDETASEFLINMGKTLKNILPTLPFMPLDVTTISRDADVVEKQKHDPLVYHGRVRVGMASGLVTEGRAARDRLGELHLPILLMHGTGDKLTPVSGSQWIYEKAESADKTLKLYEGLYHEVFNEPEQETVIGDMIGWLDARV